MDSATGVQDPRLFLLSSRSERGCYVGWAIVASFPTENLCSFSKIRQSSHPYTIFRLSQLLPALTPTFRLSGQIPAFSYVTPRVTAGPILSRAERKREEEGAELAKPGAFAGAFAFACCCVHLSWAVGHCVICGRRWWWSAWNS